MFQVIAYLKFLWNSKNEHGVHSPFVFNFLTKCCYDSTKFSCFAILEKYREQLLTNENYINVTDFGAGSKVFKSNKRQIGQIAKNAGISLKRAKLLFKIVQYFQPKSILEIGTSLGTATTAMHLGNQNAEITSLEGCPNTIAEAKRQFIQFNFKNTDFVNAEFSGYINENFPATSTKTFDLIYFDGNHSKEATLNYFELLLHTLTNETLWIFDDIHWSADMESAWEAIKKHPKVSVTIDTFQWGIVFFRKEQAKENFIIRV